MKKVICDIDGVLLHTNQPIPGAAQFIQKLKEHNVPYILLTNYPSQTQADLHNRLAQAGIEVPADHFYTSAMATASFLEKQDGRKAYVIGEGALTHELYRIGFTMTDINPDYVIVGETRAYNWEMIGKAAYFILENNARFIATNPDVAGHRAYPACGALCAPIERITGKKPFYIGKPSSLIMRTALDQMGAHSEETVIIGDNMSTDILAGVQAGIETYLVLTGVTKEADLDKYSYQPGKIFNSLDEIEF
ncbi:MAG: HAD-IIA family hydrolase [Phycisphaerae bacterium]|nr:HAD-IIA family hydrolase [Phycisphaerae bacterium]